MIAKPLNAGQVQLLAYEQSHDAKTVEWLNSAVLRQTFGISHPVSLESHRKWIESASDALIWAICADDVGYCGNVLLHCSQAHHSAYFQIYLGEVQARGRGIGRTALHAILHHAFGSLALHRVWLHTIPDNAAAETLYRSAGFVEEGLERDALFREGRYQSQRRWSLLAGEWEAKCKAGVP